MKTVAVLNYPGVVDRNLRHLDGEERGACVPPSGNGRLLNAFRRSGFSVDCSVTLWPQDTQGLVTCRAEALAKAGGWPPRKGRRVSHLNGGLLIHFRPDSRTLLYVRIGFSYANQEHNEFYGGTPNGVGGSEVGEETTRAKNNHMGLHLGHDVDICVSEKVSIKPEARYAALVMTAAVGAVTRRSETRSSRSLPGPSPRCKSPARA